MKIRNYLLLIASYFFYACWNPKFIILLFTTTLITYISGIVLENVKSRKYELNEERKKKNVVVAVSFIINLGILKYDGETISLEKVTFFHS